MCLHLCRYLVIFLHFSLAFVTAGADSCFTSAIQPPTSLDFPLEDLGQSLESYLHRVSFLLPSYFHAFVLTMINYSIS
jgi:hypothetical protein